MDLVGPYAWSTECPLEKWFRDAKIYQLFEGTAEIQRLVISRMQAGEYRERLARFGRRRRRRRRRQWPPARPTVPRSGAKSSAVPRSSGARRERRPPRLASAFAGKGPGGGRVSGTRLASKSPRSQFSRGRLVQQMRAIRIPDEPGRRARASRSR